MEAQFSIGQVVNARNRLWRVEQVINAIDIANKLNEIDKMLHILEETKIVKDTYIVEVIRQVFDPNKNNRS